MTYSDLVVPITVRGRKAKEGVVTTDDFHFARNFLGNMLLVDDGFGESGTGVFFHQFRCFSDSAVNVGTDEGVARLGVDGLEDELEDVESFGEIENVGSVVVDFFGVSFLLRNGVEEGDREDCLFRFADEILKITRKY